MPPKGSKKTAAGADALPWDDNTRMALLHAMALKYHPRKFDGAEWEEMAADMGGPFVGKGDAVSQYFFKNVRGAELQQKDRGDYVFVLDKVGKPNMTGGIPTKTVRKDQKAGQKRKSAAEKLKSSTRPEKAAKILPNPKEVNMVEPESEVEVFVGEAEESETFMRGWCAVA